MSPEERPHGAGNDEIPAAPIQIHYRSDRRVVAVDRPGLTLLDVAVRYKIPHFRECGGHGKCTTCRVRILEGAANVSPRTPAEVRMANERGWDELTRLACQARILGPVTIDRLVRTGADVTRLQLEEFPSGEGKEIPLAILFCDIREFTPLVERNLPYDVVHMLNRFFTSIGEPILLNNGFIYQYVGDAITGLFGVGGDAPDRCCLAAVRAGLGMLAALDELNERLRAEFGTEIDIGIGVHFGAAIVGHMGHPSHLQFGLVGDAVNVASRIEAMNRSLGTRFLASEELLARIPDAPVATGRRATVHLKGKSQPFPLVEVRGFASLDPMLVVQETVGALLERPDRFAGELYERMFALAPALRELFPAKLEQQGQMVTHMVQVLTYALSRPEHLELGLRDLGRRHVAYRVAPEHYGVFRQAFLDTVAAVLGPKHTAAIREAWSAIIDRIIERMIAAGRPHGNGGPA